MARAGVKHNVVPHEFVIEGDRRFMPEEDEDECVTEIRAAIDRARQADPRLECDLQVRPLYTSFANEYGDPWVEDVCRLASRVRGEQITTAGLTGSTDVAHVARVTGARVAIHGLARFEETRNHAPDERCRISDLLALTELVAGIATRAS